MGQGLAGTCLAWQFHRRDVPFTIVDQEQGGSSRVAAGLINPITGKNFEPSVRIDEFFPQAIEFYQAIETEFNCTLWHPLPIVRLASSQKEWDKILSKLDQPHVSPWLANQGEPMDDWHGAVRLKNGGRLDTCAFLDLSRDFFKQLDCYQSSYIDPDKPPQNSIWCEGAVGLMRGTYGPHRCAKGEILTLKAPSWNIDHIRVGAGGWLIPIGDNQYKVGSTYNWDELNEEPTEEGRTRIEEIAGKLGNKHFEIIEHVAGIRPILRRSEPLIGQLNDTQWMFNGLGSKGSLYAPGVAHHLADGLINNTPPDPYLDFNEFLKE